MANPRLNLLSLDQVLPLIVPELGAARIPLRKTTIQLLQISLKFGGDIKLVLRALVQCGLEHPDSQVSRETLVALPILFPSDFDTRYGNRNLFVLVSVHWLV